MAKPWYTEGCIQTATIMGKTEGNPTADKASDLNRVRLGHSFLLSHTVTTRLKGGSRKGYLDIFSLFCKVSEPHSGMTPQATDWN